MHGLSLIFCLIREKKVWRKKEIGKEWLLLCTKEKEKMLKENREVVWFFEWTKMSLWSIH